MTNLPEHAQHGQMRVSDADRDQVAAVLREATGQGRITFDELEERLSLTYAAKTYSELAEITHDLPITGTPAPATAPSAGSFPAERMGGSPGPTRAVAVMSESTHKGAWVVPREFQALAVMGQVSIDLRSARFAERETTITAYAVMGEVEITVGDDVEVDVSGFGFMGSFQHGASGPGLPGAPRVRITGFALMGEVSVKRKPLRDKLGRGKARRQIRD